MFQVRIRNKRVKPVGSGNEILGLLYVTYLNIIEEEMSISKVEHHLLHPETQLYHRVGILNRDSR
jgi:hypothetical protein